MTNDPDLMAFNNWRAVQPDVEQSGLVFAANDHAAKSCSVWWAGAGTEFLDRMRAEARARGITLLVNHAPYSRQELQEAVALIWGRRERLGQLGFGLQTIAGPTPTFFGLTVAGFVLGDEEAKQLPPALVASVRGELADLLGDCQVRLDDVRIEYGRVYPASVSAAAHAPACDNRPMPERLEVQRAVAASAGEIFAVLTDPRGHVAIDSSGMLTAASGDAVTKAGDTFVVHMDREALNDYPLGLYDVTIEIVTFEQDREIAWTVHGQFDLGHVYGYRLEPIAQGTLVTSYYDWSAVDQSWKDAAIFPVIPESALRATLGILARTAAPGKPRPALEDE